MQIETIRLWPDRDDVELTTFLNKPDPFLKNDVPRPAVIVCPGGAYATCDRHSAEGDPVAMGFAMDGYQAFVLEYSVTSRAPEGKTVYPAMLLDYVFESTQKNGMSILQRSRFSAFLPEATCAARSPRNGRTVF